MFTPNLIFRSRLTFIAYIFLFSALALQPSKSSAQQPQRYDIIIDEIFADPTPTVGLPNAEFIELYNNSTFAIDLKNFKISNSTSSAIIKNSYVLKPESFVVLCSNSAASQYAPFGPALGVSSFPSLHNDEDTISLEAANGTTLHAVAYANNWFRNDVKSDGGWSLEMIDRKLPCAGAENWTASIHPSGGTPGQTNSVNGTNSDAQPPALLRTYTLDSVTIVGIFDEPIDSILASDPNNYALSPLSTIALQAHCLPPLFNEVLLKMPTPLQVGTVYNLTASNIPDCSGNMIGANNFAKAGLPVYPTDTNMIINEILFNPPPGGSDYVELYNRSNKTINLQDLVLANRTATGNIDNITRISTKPFNIFPNEFITVTPDANWVKQHYTVTNPDRLFTVSGFPSMPDDAGDIVLLTRSGNAIDEVAYDHKWHFALVNNEEGIALERIDANGPSQSSSNWTSASSTSGFGTPTSKNSQAGSSEAAKGDIEIQPTVFSPDNDGVDDNCFIRYHFSTPSKVANITALNVNGQIVKRIANNVLLGLDGSLRWDGLDDNNNPLPSGIYVLLVRVFSLDGSTKQWKLTVTLARRW